MDFNLLCGGVESCSDVSVSLIVLSPIFFTLIFRNTIRHLRAGNLIITLARVRTILIRLAFAVIANDSHESYVSHRNSGIFNIMSRGLKWFLGFIFTVFIAVGAVLFLVRSNDGPMEILSGGPFRTGELMTTPVDWSFLTDHATIELQTMAPPRSRTRWLAVYDNRLFVISSYMNSRVGKIWKQWPNQIKENNLSVVRADGKLYELQLIRHTEGEFIDGVLKLFNEKYSKNLSADSIDSGNAWLFELTGR
jgi:hypothetical protein